MVLQTKQNDVRSAGQSKPWQELFASYWPFVLAIVCLLLLLVMSTLPLLADIFLTSLAPTSKPIWACAPINPEADLQSKQWQTHFSAGKAALRVLNFSAAKDELERAFNEAQEFNGNDPRKDATAEALGIALYRTGDLSRSENLLKKQREIYLGMSPSFPAIKQACSLLSCVENDLGKYEEARQYAQEALAVLQEHPTESFHSWDILIELAIANYGLKRNEQALDCEKQALEKLKASSPLSDCENALTLESNQLLSRADSNPRYAYPLLLAAEHCTRALMNMQQEAKKPVALVTYLQYGKISKKKSAPEEAERVLEKAASVRRATDAPGDVINLAVELCDLYERRPGTPEKQAWRAALVLNLLSGLNDAQLEERAMRLPAKAFFDARRFSEARLWYASWLKRLAEEHRTGGESEYEVRTWLGYCDYNLANLKAAQRDYLAALKIATRLHGKKSKQVYQSLKGVGDTLLAQNELLEAERTYENVLDLGASQAFQPEASLEIETRVQLAITRLKLGKHSQSIALFDQASKMAEASGNKNSADIVKINRQRYLKKEAP